MVPVTAAQLAAVRAWFLPERPGPLVAQHVILTGHGRCLADRWPDPRALVVESAGNYLLAGDPGALDPGELRGQVVGFVDAAEPFAPLLRAAFGEVPEWPRAVFAQERLPVRRRALPPGQVVRQFVPADAGALGRLGGETAWISATWGGPAGLAASGMGWGAFVDGRLAAVACPFFAGWRYEDIGVATEPAHRRLGLSTACAAEVCHDIRRRGRTPTWTTSPDNLASLRVAAKLGFTLARRDRLYVVGRPVPAPPST
jgi:ribosomal protein S18 acetylase RimI-like enzyme